MSQQTNERQYLEGAPDLERRVFGRADFKALREYELTLQELYNPELHAELLTELEAAQAKIQAQATATLLAQLVSQGVGDDRIDDLRIELEYQFQQAFTYQNLQYVRRITERSQRA